MTWQTIPFGCASQWGEGVALLYIFNKIGATNRLAVDIGAADGSRQSNTKLLEQVSNFRRIMFDIAPGSPDVIEQNVTAENVNGILEDHNVPDDFDLFSLDIDGNDYWIWKALKYTPRVVVMEYNHSLGFQESKTIKYNPHHRFNNNQYYGASAVALMKLGSSLGYKCIARSATNMIFVKDELAVDAKEITLPDQGAITGQKRGWPAAPKGSIWISV